jgi:PurA ssDNA and RNA-binding protein
VDTHHHSVDVRVERKQFTFDLKENPQGTFLRITETVNSGRRDAIIIPTPGLEPFRDALNEVIKFSKTPEGSRAILPLGRRKAGKPAPDGSTDLTMGS